MREPSRNRSKPRSVSPSPCAMAGAGQGEAQVKDGQVSSHALNIGTRRPAQRPLSPDRQDPASRGNGPTRRAARRAGPCRTSIRGRRTDARCASAAPWGARRADHDVVEQGRQPAFPAAMKNRAVVGCAAIRLCSARSAWGSWSRTSPGPPITISTPERPKRRSYSSSPGPSFRSPATISRSPSARCLSIRRRSQMHCASCLRRLAMARLMASSSVLAPWGALDFTCTPMRRIGPIGVSSAASSGGLEKVTTSSVASMSRSMRNDVEARRLRASMFAGGRSFRVVTRGDHIGIVEQHQLLLRLVRETIQHRTGADAGVSGEIPERGFAVMAAGDVGRLHHHDRVGVDGAEHGGQGVDLSARLTPSRPERSSSYQKRAGRCRTARETIRRCMSRSASGQAAPRRARIVSQAALIAASRASASFTASSGMPRASMRSGWVARTSARQAARTVSRSAPGSTPRTA
jgi:hypothetical protein